MYTFVNAPKKGSDGKAEQTRHEDKHLLFVLSVSCCDIYCLLDHCVIFSFIDRCMRGLIRTAFDQIETHGALTLKKV